VDCIFNINKPQGSTSYSIVAFIRRLSGEKRVGHAGTLDPLATGVLPVCLGQGTRVIEYLSDYTKTYHTCIELGITTDTYDAQGKIIQQIDASDIKQEQVLSALDSFRGTIQQVPPMYSAVKLNGQPLYKLARAGITVERQSRSVTIHHLELIKWHPPEISIEIECSKGTYIRSLAHDMGQILGCGAYLKNLVRTEYGPYSIKDSVSVTDLENAFQKGSWQQYAYPLDSALAHLTAITVDKPTGLAISQGKPVALDESLKRQETSPENKAMLIIRDNLYRAYTQDGHLLGILYYDEAEDILKPRKIFPSQITLLD